MWNALWSIMQRKRSATLRHYPKLVLAAKGKPATVALPIGIDWKAAQQFVAVLHSLMLTWWFLGILGDAYTRPIMSIRFPSWHHLQVLVLDLEMKVKHNKTVKWALTDNCSGFDLPVALHQLQQIRATPAASGVSVLQNLPPSLCAHELPLESSQT